MKNTIRLTESDLKRVISESVKNVISEASSFAEEISQEFPEFSKIAKRWRSCKMNKITATYNGCNLGNILGEIYAICRKDNRYYDEFEEATGMGVGEFLTHWNKVHNALEAIEHRYTKPSEDANDGGYYDWH